MLNFERTWFVKLNFDPKYTFLAFDLKILVFIPELLAFK